MIKMIIIYDEKERDLARELIHKNNINYPHLNVCIKNIKHGLHFHGNKGRLTKEIYKVNELLKKLEEAN